MNIQIDTREKAKAIKKIIKAFEANGITYYSSKLYVGDYMSLDNPRLIIDRKQNLSEIYSNLCNGRKRFENELQRAKDAGIHICILCEHSNRTNSLQDVKAWYNPRLGKSPYAWDGETMYKQMLLVAKKYDIEWIFCDKASTGEKIIKLLR